MVAGLGGSFRRGNDDGLISGCHKGERGGKWGRLSLERRWEGGELLATEGKRGGPKQESGLGIWGDRLTDF